VRWSHRPDDVFYYKAGDCIDRQGLPGCLACCLYDLSYDAADPANVEALQYHEQCDTYGTVVLEFRAACKARDFQHLALHLRTQRQTLNIHPPLRCSPPNCTPLQDLAAMYVRCLPFKARVTKLGKVFNKIDWRCDTEELSGNNVREYPATFVHNVTTQEGLEAEDTRVLEIHWRQADRSAIKLPRHLDPDLPAMSTTLSNLHDIGMIEARFSAPSHPPKAL
jgi:hypothetical protein